jgi:hypothetical protein
MFARLQDKNVQILDVRTRDEFAGVDVRAIRGGHVPGAVNIPYEENWVDPGTPGKLARREVANNRGMSLSPRPTCAISIRGSTQQGNDRLLPKRRALGGDGRCARQARLPQR